MISNRSRAFDLYRSAQAPSGAEAAVLLQLQAWPTRIHSAKELLDDVEIVLDTRMDRRTREDVLLSFTAELSFVNIVAMNARGGFSVDEVAEAMKIQRELEDTYPMSQTVVALAGFLRPILADPNGPSIWKGVVNALTLAREQEDPGMLGQIASLI